MIQKEKKVCEKLGEWFNRYGIDCYQNYGKNSFKIKGTRKKPDLLIYSHKLKQHIIIEVKTGLILRDVYDAQKILNLYYMNYYNHKTIYLLNNVEIKIDSFAVATYFSQSGRLFKYENLVDVEDKENDEWKKINKYYQLEPLHEYDKTMSYLRQLWSTWRTYRIKKYMPGCGIIVSDNLNQNVVKHNKIDKPILFDQQWEFIKGKYQWKVRQKIL